jgi:hypothetical protein
MEGGEVKFLNITPNPNLATVRAKNAKRDAKYFLIKQGAEVAKGRKGGLRWLRRTSEKAD